MSPFTVYPALDVLEGRCVRLHEGVREQVTVEGGDPAAAASGFVAEGASWLHLVDLDGAFAGTPTPGLVEGIARAADGVPLQVGGGYRSVHAVARALAAGATRVMVGTAALEPETLTELVRRFGERIVVAVDARDGVVVAEGWTASSDLRATELAGRCADAGVSRLLVTSTRRDGSLDGPDLELLGEVREASGLPVLAAGGIAALEHLTAIRDLGCEGAVVGSAIWRGRFTLTEALAHLGRLAPGQT